MPSLPAASTGFEPRWPALLALLAVGGLHWLLPESLTIGPSWLMLVIVAVLAVPLVIAHVQGHHKTNKRLGHLMLGLVTLFMIFSLGALIQALPDHQQSPQELLRSAAALWVANLLVFASWYWRLDAGGPHAREIRGAHTDGAFLFPQMTFDDCDEVKWSPGFVDYLFLAFNTSTAFSPTDVPVLSRWAKGLMMVQASISFTTVALIAARAVNIL